MNTERIKSLASTIEKLRAAKFVAKDKELKAEGFSYLTVDECDSIAAALNRAIKPILDNLETELRKELAACAKK